jgi:type IV pilus assembly protein PilA
MKFKGMKQAGFSLVELMVVVGIIGILAAIAVPKLQVFTAKAKQSEARATLKSIDTFQQSYFAENSTYGSTYALIGMASAPSTKNYTFGDPSSTDFVTLYSVEATSRSKLCGGGTGTQVDKWTVNQFGTISNSQNGLNGC